MTNILESKHTEAKVQQRREQMFWFINRFILFSKKPISEIGNEYNEVVLFPVDTLGKEAGELFPLHGPDLQGGETNNEIYAIYCVDMLNSIKNNLYKIENKVTSLKTEKFIWYEQDDNLNRDHSYDYNDNYNIVISYDLMPFFEVYLHYLKDNKPIVENKDSQISIKKIEALEDKTENKRITIYVNGDYNNPIGFSRGKNWSKFYELAKVQEIDSNNKDFFDYYNYNKSNPLYTNTGFKITQILKIEDGLIVPNIEIKLTTQNKITRQLKSA